MSTPIQNRPIQRGAGVEEQGGSEGVQQVLSEALGLHGEGDVYE